MSAETFLDTQPAPAARPPLALFLTGPSGSGKATLAEAWVRHRIALGEPWCLLNKYVVAGRYAPKLMTLLGGQAGDRGTPLYKREVRDLDYQTTLDLAAAQLALGVNVMMPGPWSRELADGKLYRPERFGAPEARSLVVWLQVSDEERKRRIAERGRPEDAWKLKVWSTYAGAGVTRRPSGKGGVAFVLPANGPISELVDGLDSLVSEADDV